MATAPHSKDGVFWTLVLMTTLLTIGQSAHAQQSARCDDVAGTIVSVEGQVTIDGQVASLNQSVCAGSVVSVGTNSRSGIRLVQTQSVIRMDSNSEFVIQPAPENASILDVIKGVIYLFTRQPQSFRVETPYFNAAIEGTEFVVDVGTNQSQITLIEGALRAVNDNGELLLAPGESAIAGASQAPVRRSVVNTFESVQWALYYPPIGASQSASSASRDAATLLESGREQAASTQLAAAIKADRSDATAWALRSMIATVQGNRIEARDLARTALAASAESSPAWTALSYVEQADRQLDKAASSAAKAIDLTPGDAYAWARLAELQVATGELDDARNSANQAAQLEPALSRTQSVLGFIRLARGDIDRALAAFSQAIDNDSEDPLARLGAGLAHIRQGKPGQGRSQIEIAAILDPGNSLIRSYLGKAYFNEKQTQLASQQFDLAMRLDANDPTPWLYAAILSQSLNRPIRALEQLRESIKRNDNRSVYRSRLDLDSDMSSRQTRQGTIYSDLGFEQAALLEGWKSLARNPDNSAAHRLLADSYLELPRHQFARDSELLQSQMLQPINLTPVQPSLSTGDLSLSVDTAQDRAGLNEYSRLFTADNKNLHLQALGGSNDTLSGEAILSGLSERVSYSLGASHFRTDGVRENNDSTQDTANAFLQYAPRHDTSVQFEWRVDDKREGDRVLLFDQGYSLPTQRITNEQTTWRLGLSHQFSARQRVLASLSDSLGKTTIFDIDETDQPFNDLDLQDDFQIAELRHLMELGKSHLNSGFSAMRGETRQQGLFDGEQLPNSRFDVEHALAYTYWDYAPNTALTLTAGLSHAAFENSRADFSRFNPKFGLLWNVASTTTLRAAYTRNVKRPFTANQTLEPVSVAGFNQLFNDADGTIATRVGVGIDHWISNGLAVGVEASHRELEVPIGLSAPFADEDEQLFRAYAHWTLSPRLAIGLEASYERFDLELDRQRSEFFSEMDLLRIPANVRYFHSDKVYSRATATWISQDGRFDTNEGDDLPEESTFAVLDLAIGYRLPGQLGILSVEVRNVFDETFQFQNSGRQDLADDFNSPVAFGREVYLNAVVTF